MIEEILYCPHIRCNSVFCQISFGEIAFEFCYHIILIYNEYGNNIIEYIRHYTQLPNGWCTTTLKDLCENINGLWKGKKEPFVHVGVIRNANFTKDFKLEYSNIEYIDVEQRTFTKRHLMNGDLIVEKSGGSDNNPVGRTILYEGEGGVFSFSNFTMVLRIKYSNTILSKFLYYYILAIYQTGAMRLMQTQTTGLHNLILDKFLLMPIYLPPSSEQKRIIDKIEMIFATLDMIMESL